MRRIVLATTVAAAFALQGCDSTSPLLPERDALVVRAYLYAGEAVTDIQLTTTYPLASDDPAGLPINDAAVRLEKNGANYALTRSAGDSGYYHYAGNDLVVQVGDRFKIVVDRAGATAIGETTIPAPPRNLKISQNEFVIDAGTPFDTSSITLSWEGEDTFYFVVLENLETAPAPISNMPFPGRAQQTFRSRPVRALSYNIRRFDLRYYGEHRARVYKVNQEYAELYAFGQQDSRNLNEPQTNIKNGLGIFAGFSSAEINFRVVKQ